jgi:hypothetical protein
VDESVAVVAQPSAEFRLIARDPQELEAARRHLNAFLGAKLLELDEEFKAVETNLEIALKFPIRTQPLKAQLNRIEKLRRYYEKAKAAVDAGFHIIPNFRADVFAIRTNRSARGIGADSTWSRRNALDRMPDQKAQILPSGEGNYASPTPRGYVNAWTEPTKDGKGEVTKYAATVTDYAEIDFPFVFARPEVLTATQQVMAAKIFDELGTLPQQRGGDPMVVGIIRESNERNAKSMTFLVVWFLDTNTL